MIIRFFLLVTILLSYQLKSQSDFPIMAFHGVETAKVEDFETFKNAGFNISLSVYHSTEKMLKNLDAANKASVKLFVYSDSLVVYPKQVINKIKDHPAFYGSFISDEPTAEHFPMLRWRILGIKEYDKKRAFYVNLLPNYASKEQLGTDSYMDYLEKFLQTVPVEFFSFDYYPIKNNKVEASWYQNLENIRDVSIKYNKPFWGYANSTVFHDYKQPTLGGLKLQQFGNLLYGAKGLQYFTYWTLEKEYRVKNNFQYSIVDEDARPTPTYDLVKKVNTQIHNLSWIFLDATVNKVYHDGKAYPIGTRKLTYLPPNFSKFNTTKESILVSYLESPLNNFVIVQNKDLVNSISLSFKPSVKMQIVNSETGISSYISTKETSSVILPGDILIFKILKR
ncbi:hypothetical protein EGH90_07200 [Kaistella haifensis]|nr:hypothetical protein EGH90_07200 [Kaistella haifensis]